VRRFKGMMSIDTDDGDDEALDAEVSLGDLEALQGVVKFPVRIKCATLGWNTLAEALDDAG
jgi:nitrogen fixation NifU-like protein